MRLGNAPELPHFPPSWEKAGTHWGNTETLWPTSIFPVDDPRVAALVTEVRRNFGGGFHEGTIRWSPGTPQSAIHPYMSSYTTMASLVRGEHEQVVGGFLLVPAALDGHARVCGGDFCPETRGLERYDPPCHRGVELRFPAAAHALARAGR